MTLDRKMQVKFAIKNAGLCASTSLIVLILTALAILVFAKHMLIWVSINQGAWGLLLWGF